MTRPVLEKGLVQVYTGDGKGKTTAALGLCLRAVGRGFRVCFVQFVKGRGETGEAVACKRVSPDFEMRRFGTGRFIRGSPSDQDRVEGEKALSAARDAVSSGDYGVVVLDEISHAVNLGVVSERDVVCMIRTRPAHVEVVLTGRGMPQGLLDEADLVSEMLERKHPFRSNVRARPGIEY